VQERKTNIAETDHGRQWPDPKSERGGSMACTLLDVKNRWPKEEMIPLCDDLNLAATKSELIKVAMMWKSGFNLKDMAKYLRPNDKLENTMDEVWIMCMHLSRQGMIEEREGGHLGSPDIIGKDLLEEVQK